MHEIATAFFISKSENKNQVHYAVSVNDACEVASAAPVHAYWRMFEKGETATEPLLEREVPAYGIASQTPITGGVRVVLRALPARALDVRTWRNEDGSCSSSVTTTIAGVPSRLFNVHLALRLFGVQYVLLTGWDNENKVVREKLIP